MIYGTATVNLGDAEVRVEYEYQAGEESNYDSASPGVGPGRDASLTIIQVLVNGIWVDPNDIISTMQIERWKQKILDDKAKAMRDTEGASVAVFEVVVSIEAAE